MQRKERRLTKRERKAMNSPARQFEAEVHARAAMDSPDAVVHINGIPGMRKMSDVLVEWGAPLLAPFENAPIETFRNALAFAGLVWTAATDDTNTPEAVVDRLFERMATPGAETPNDMREAVLALVQSRRVDYADDPRLVLKTEAWDKGDERRLHVASAIPGPKSLKPSP